VLRPDAQDKLDIYEEEIPREGVRVTRAFQHARWLNGAPLCGSGGTSSRAGARDRAG